MALHVVAARTDPALFRLPWSRPLADWEDWYVVPLPLGLSRHVVRVVQVNRQFIAVKETAEPIALREYHLLRDLQRLDQPAVVPRGVVTGRVSGSGEPLPAALLTEHLHYSLPYRTLFQRGLRAEQVPALVDALVVLLVRLHLAGFFWGDVSLSNALFRRSAGGFSAFLVDAETGELRSHLSDAMREHDVTVGVENIFAELMDLQASGDTDIDVDGQEVVAQLADRYHALWDELTAAEEFGTDEWYRVEQRIARLNDLGFDVDELDVQTDSDRVRIQPKVVEAGHHRRELRELTGLVAEDSQARKLLNDLAAYTAHFGYDDEDRETVARRWLTTIYTPIVALLPPELRRAIAPAEYFHEVMEHRWALSDEAGHEVDIFDSARDYVANVLPHRPPDQPGPATVPEGG
ncbi:DUF4032 domain-containing protein [Pimelobacter simplex]|uniref:Chromosome segregation ATPase n=1 Tax=Nocardioides simplex TaxID=2045 RepID=A0A0A1DIY4_NOCSI|nr:DUF4032 domain-containing protein [Pimelobacter simplex]AIY16488.1 Chromosome segregation ATPase [Pimelobacter simplex]MCG8154350.1 DUF4032 domain-containing protein [Pimelobacter simplex]GEB11788.1 LPS kinase [Pimelobacter simplex]SFN01707.1 protein of unknown function [Pimelobacter simplex]